MMISINQCFRDETLINEGHEVLHVASEEEANLACQLLEEADRLVGHYKSYYIGYPVVGGNPTTTLEILKAQVTEMQSL